MERKAPCNYVDDSVDDPEQWCVKKARSPASNLFDHCHKYCEQYCQGIRPQRWSIFGHDGMSMVFHMSTIGINGFSNGFSIRDNGYSMFFTVGPLVSMVCPMVFP